jgi:hypothetical protein
MEKSRSTGMAKHLVYRFAQRRGFCSHNLHLGMRIWDRAYQRGDQRYWHTHWSMVSVLRRLELGRGLVRSYWVYAYDRVLHRNASNVVG